MLADKDIPATWVPYRAGLCENCRAACCTMPVEMRWPDIVRLGWAQAEEEAKKAAKRLVKAGLVSRYRDATGIFTMAAKSDGACALLTPERRCSAYEKRPETCRNFPRVSSRPGYCPASPLPAKPVKSG